MFDKTILRGLLVAALATSATAGWANTVTMATVPVGDAGNQADTTGYGQVNYNYQIGTYDVTDNQYAAFLQAVAGTIDPYGLWNNLMENDPDGGGSEGGISRTGNGPYTYSVKPGQGNQPVACETWLDAVRFVNWLSNGQGTGSTESGPYTITGGGYNSGTVTVPTASQRATWGAGGSGVVWLLPTANEWYKAAYYKGGSTNAGYWLYPYQSNTPPTSQAPPGGSNSANIFSSTTGFALTQSTSYVDTQDYLTDVNAYGSSLGPYGTVGQGGNVFQWDEALIGSARARWAGRTGAPRATWSPVRPAATTTAQPTRSRRSASVSYAWEPTLPACGRRPSPETGAMRPNGRAACPTPTAPGPRSMSQPAPG